MSDFIFLIPVILIAIIISFIVIRFPVSGNTEIEAERNRLTELLEKRKHIVERLIEDAKKRKNKLYEFEVIEFPTLIEINWIKENEPKFKMGDTIKSITVLLPMQCRVDYVPKIANIYKCYNSKTDKVIYLHEYELSMLK